MNHWLFQYLFYIMLFVKTGVISKEKQGASSREIASEFHRPPVLTDGGWLEGVHFGEEVLPYFNFSAVSVDLDKLILTKYFWAGWLDIDQVRPANSHDSAVTSRFFNSSHGLTSRLPISLFFGKYHSEGKCYLVE